MKRKPREISAATPNGLESYIKALSDVEGLSTVTPTVLSPPLLLLSCGHAHKRRLHALLERELGATMLLDVIATMPSKKSHHGDSSHQLIPFMFGPESEDRDTVTAAAPLDRLVEDWRLWGGARPVHNLHFVSVVVG